MKPVLFHRWYDPPSERVIEFLKDRHLDHLVEYVDIDDEDEMGSSRLTALTGGTNVPCLIVDMHALSSEKEIVRWFEGHLEHRHDYL